MPILPSLVPRRKLIGPPPRRAAGRSVRALAIGGVALLGALSSLFLLLPAQDLPVMPGAGERRLEPDLIPFAQRAEARADIWPTEVFAEAAADRLKALASEVVMKSGRLDAAAAGLFASDACTSGDLRPAKLQDVFSDRTILVRRLEAAPAARAAAPHRGREGFARAVTGLFAPLAGAKDARIEFEIVGVTLQGAAVETRLWMHADATGSAGRVEQTAELAARWIAPAGGAPPLLERLEVIEYEEAVLARGGRAMFADVTASAIGSSRAWREQLLPGVDHFLERLETWIEGDSFGHHGLAVGDVNGDGLDDLYVCQMGGLPNLLFVQNLDGTATERSAEAGVDWLERSRSALFVDLDNDGDQDLVIATSVSLLFMDNDGTGRFTVKASLTATGDAVRQGQPSARPSGLQAGGVDGGHYYKGPDLGGVATSDLVMMAAADYDQDGFVDVYACTYHASSEEADRFPIPVPYHDARNGGNNVLLKNDGRWGFTDVTKETGLDANNTQFSFAAAWEDYDNDGDQDLFVANDFGRKNLYRNDSGRFTDVAAAAGVEDIGAGMSAAWGDYNGDGWMDLYVGNMWSSAGLRLSAQEAFQKGAPESIRALYRRHARGNSLFANLGDGTFRDVSEPAGVTMGRWAWSSNLLDVNDDGLEDILVANGYFTRDEPRDLCSFFWRQVVGRSPHEAVPPATVPDYTTSWRALGRLIRMGWSFNGSERNGVFLNTGGSRFATVSGISGLDYIDDARAAAVVDWDLDGDQDVWLANRTGPRLRLALNQSGTGRSVNVRLVGTSANRDGIGARLEAHIAGPPPRRLIRTLRAGEAYLAQSSKWVHFGLGEAPGIERLVVRWPGGGVDEVTGLVAGRRYVVSEGSGRAEPFAPPKRSVALAPSAGAATPGPPPPTMQARIYLSAPVPAPTLDYEDMQGKRADASRLPPGRVLLYLWASWHAPCEKDLADLAAAAETLGKAGVRVLALSVDGVAPGARGSREDARRVAGRLKPPFATGFADAALIDKLQLVQTKVITIPRPFPVPTAVLVDGDGLLAALYKGPLDLPKLIDDLPSLRISGERRVAVAIPFPGRRQTRGYPPFFEYMDGIAQVYAANGYPEEAEAHYRKVLRIRPGTAEAHLNLAIALAGQGKIDQAIEQYGKALEAEPENAAARNNLGFALAGQGRVEEAILHYREAIRIEPGNVSALTNLGNALAGLGRAEEAVDLYRRAVAADPANAPARNNLALALARQGNDAEAIGMYREILKSDPENPLVRINLGIALVRLAKLSEAESELAEAVRLKPDQPEAHYHLGLVLARQRRFGEAAGRFGEAVRLKPGYGQALYYLGLCLAHQGDVEQAVSRLAEATGQPSQTGAASQRLAWVLATHPDAVFRDGAKAVRIARHLVESGGDGSFLVMDTLGAAYAEAGSFTDAIVAARRAVELADGSGEAQQAARIRERLRLYESGRAFHESAGSGR